MLGIAASHSVTNFCWPSILGCINCMWTEKNLNLLLCT